MSGKKDGLEPIRLRKEVTVGASPAELWPLISNTNRFNRGVGIPAMTVSGVGADFAKQVRVRYWGIPLLWKELPFEWIEGQFYRVVRLFSGGPLVRFEGGIAVEKVDGGSRLVVDADFTPRNAAGELLVRWAAGRKVVSDSVKLLRKYEASLKRAQFALPAPARAENQIRADVLETKSRALSRLPIDQEAVRRLIALIGDGYDEDLGHMRPFELADRWGRERIETLRVFFHAVKAGLLDMNWEILCPNCSGANENLGHLQNLKNYGHCSFCNADYGVNFDESVELRFRVNAAVRPIESAVFCVGSPSEAPFAVAQLTLKGREPRSVSIELGAESYLLRDLSAKKRIWLRPHFDAPADLKIDLIAAENLSELRFKPGTMALTLVAGEPPSLIRLERESWREKAAKASIVTALQDFREQFSSEVLSPGVEIGIRSVAILFSDLKDSTALYERIGEAVAYSLVHEHFDFLFDIIKRHEGAVVKTIGDAVMAVFATGSSALSAALEIQGKVGELNASLSPKPAVVIKLGLHQGPAIAINANGAVDYFGTTVNVAARVQNESRGGDVVVSAAIAEDPRSREVLKAHQLKTDEFSIQLKGLTDVFRLWRLAPEARHG